MWSWPNGWRDLFFSSASGFKSHNARLSPPRCLTCSLDLQDVQWVRRLVVVRINWPGHPGYIKKIKYDLSPDCSLQYDPFFLILNWIDFFIYIFPQIKLDLIHIIQVTINEILKIKNIFVGGCITSRWKNQVSLPWIGIF